MIIRLGLHIYIDLYVYAGRHTAWDGVFCGRSHEEELVPSCHSWRRPIETTSFQG